MRPGCTAEPAGADGTRALCCPQNLVVLGPLVAASAKLFSLSVSVCPGAQNYYVALSTV